MVAMRSSTSRALPPTENRRTSLPGYAALVIGTVCLVLAGCDALNSETSSPPPPPAPAPTAAPAAEPAPAAAAPEPVPTPEVEVPKAASARVLPPKPSPAADKETRSDLLLQHYRTLRCLTLKGANTAEVSAAFAASGLTPQVWNQALGELLQEMAKSPEGDVARAFRAADTEVCPGGGTP